MGKLAKNGTSVDLINNLTRYTDSIWRYVKHWNHFFARNWHFFKKNCKHQQRPNAAFRIGCYNFSCSLQMWFNSFAEAIKTLTLWGHSKRTKMGVIKRVKKEIVAMNHRRCKKDHKRWLKLPKKINIGKWQGALCCRCVRTRYRIVLLYCSIFLKNNNQPDHLL